MLRQGFSVPAWLAVAVLLLAGWILFPLQQSGAQQPSARTSADKSSTDKSSADKSSADKSSADKSSADKSKVNLGNKTRTAKKNALRSANRKPVSEAQVKKVEAFLTDNMPQLKDLLEVLKEGQPSRYGAAIRELYNAADRLERLEQRDKSSYDLALKSWQLDKQAQLVAARIRMDDSPQHEKKLRSLLEQRFALERKIMQRNRDRQAARLQKLDDAIQRFDETRSKAVDAQVKAWLKRPAGKGKVADVREKDKNAKRKLTGAGAKKQ